MISSVIDGTERAVGKVVVWLLGTIILSLFLLVGLLFLGYALFLFMLTWLSVIQSALFIGCLFVLGGYICMILVKRGLSDKPSQNPAMDTSSKLSESKPVKAIKENPAISLSLAVIAGFLYQNNPRLKEQANKTLATLAEQYMDDFSDKHGSDKYRSDKH